MELVAAEKHQQEAVKSALAQNKTLSMLDEILEDVRKAADRLEEEIEEHAFDQNKQVALDSQVYKFYKTGIALCQQPSGCDSRLLPKLKKPM